MNEILNEMRSSIEADPSGKLLSEFIRKQKLAGLKKEDAYQLLFELLREQNRIAADAEARAEAISDVADCVVGNVNVDECLIYPREN